jgi:hypothetical protein
VWKNAEKPNTSFVEDFRDHNEGLQDICFTPNAIQGGRPAE